MWSFGVGLFLVKLAPESLQLVAINGLARGGSVILFSALIGDWVDKTPRLRVARVTLVLQNALVTVCAVVVFMVVVYHETLRTVWSNEGALTLCHAGIIILAILSFLASIAHKISIQRDWIVEICGRDKDLLASMSANLRAIDLSTAILAPIATGQIIYFIHLKYGAVFIAAWNLVSVFIEYVLIRKVYKQVPALKNKKLKKSKGKDIEETEEENRAIPLTEENVHDEAAENEPVTNPTESSGKKEETKVKQEETCNPVVFKIFKTFIMLFRGWKIYIKYDVAFAGLGLAALYMTVMAFDNVTVGYAYSQGISESVLGILMAAGSIFGIAGTFAFPRLHKKIGLERTGLFGFGLEVFCLCFCVAAVLAPGSPFDLLHRTKTPPTPNTEILSTTPTIFNTFDNVTVFYNLTADLLSSNSSVTSGPSSYISIGLYMGGLTAARFGLWIADLTVTQLFLQSILETERGLVSGIQGSLNQLMDSLRFIMVILAPYPEEHGLLVFISFTFICIGWGLYAKYSHSSRGHLFHFEKICPNMENNNVPNNTSIDDGGLASEATNSDNNGGQKNNIKSIV